MKKILFLGAVAILLSLGMVLVSCSDDDSGSSSGKCPGTPADCGSDDSDKRCMSFLTPAEMSDFMNPKMGLATACAMNYGGSEDGEFTCKCND
jgi:hypothetical protein